MIRAIAHFTLCRTLILCVSLFLWYHDVLSVQQGVSCIARLCRLVTLQQTKDFIPVTDCEISVLLTKCVQLCTSRYSGAYRVEPFLLNTCRNSLLITREQSYSTNRWSRIDRGRQASELIPESEVY